MRDRIGFGFVVPIVWVGLILAALGPCSAQECTGDCDGDGRVTVDELVQIVSASNEAPRIPCPGFEDGVDISALIVAVNTALFGCPTPGAEVIAYCSLIFKGGPADRPALVHVTLSVQNASGGTITDLRPLEPLDIRGGAFTILDSPINVSELRNEYSARFTWQLSSNAKLVVTAAALATGMNGESLFIGPVACK